MGLVLVSRIMALYKFTYLLTYLQLYIVQCCLCCSIAHNVDSSKGPLVCVVGALDFVSESLTSAGQWQLTCYSVSSNYSSVVQSVTLEQVDLRPTFLQAVGDDRCVCGITSKQITIWYHSSVCNSGAVLHIITYCLLIDTYLVWLVLIALYSQKGL